MGERKASYLPSYATFFVSKNSPIQPNDGLLVFAPFKLITRNGAKRIIEEIEFRCLDLKLPKSNSFSE